MIVAQSTTRFGLASKPFQKTDFTMNTKGIWIKRSQQKEGTRRLEYDECSN